MDRDVTEPTEPDGFQHMLDAEGEFVERLARRYRSPGVDPDDLQQDLWLALLRSQPSQVRSTRPWFSAVARRRAGNVRRTATVRRDREVIYAEDRAAEDAPAADLDRWVDVEAALARLPGPTRELLCMRVESGLSFAEIGRKLGISEAHARVRHHRAIQDLRRDLGVDASQAARAPSLGAGVFGWLSKTFRSHPALALGLPAMGVLVVATALLWSGVLGSAAGPEEPTTVHDGATVGALAPEAQPDAARQDLPTERGARAPISVDSADPGEDATVVDASAGEPAPVGAVRRTPLRLRVTRASGAPVMGATLYRHRVEPGGRVVTGELPTVTDVNGLADLDPLPLGSWLSAAFDDGGLSQALQVDRQADTADVVELTLRSPAHRAAGVIVDAEGRPIAGASMRFVHRGFGRSLGRVVHVEAGWLWSDVAPTAATTDAAGRYEIHSPIAISNLPVVIEAEGYAPRWMRGPRPRVVLQPYVPLRGVVRDRAGGVAANAVVRMVLDGGDRSWTTRCDGLGRFAFEEPPQGAIRLFATDGSGCGEEALSHPSEGALVLHLGETGTIRGTLTDGSGTPLSGWRIECARPLHMDATLRNQRLVRRMQSTSVTTDDRGAFGGIVPVGDRVRLAAFAPGASEPTSVRTLEEWSAALDWRVGTARRAQAIRGRVEGRDGADGREQYVLVAHDQLAGIHQVALRKDGSFRAVGFPDGDAFLEHPGLLRARGPMVKVTLPQTEPAVVRDAAVGTMHIRLRSPEGVPITRGTYHLFRGEGNGGPGDIRALQGTSITRTDEGVLVLKFSRNEPLFLQAMTPEGDLGGGMGFQPIDGSSLDIVLRPASIQRLDVVPGEGTRPISNARFAVEDDSGQTVHVRTARDHLRKGQPIRVTVRLGPGRYSLVAPARAQGELQRVPFRIEADGGIVRIELP